VASASEQGAKAEGQRIHAKPLLKWAGGKRQLLPTLRRFYPRQFNTYFEPFLGSAAVFFDLHASGHFNGRRAVLTDNNADLIACYQVVRDSTDEVLAELSQLAREHARRGHAHYYEVRDKRFNPQRATASSNEGFAYSPALAAMFIYLNRTCYNGLFRLNADGGFNVPAGRYLAPRICDEATVRTVAAALSYEHVQLAHLQFDRAVETAQSDDFLYFDPPYSPLSKTANFTSYTPGGFDRHDQARLRDVVVDLARRGCHVVMSNSTALEITELYESNKDVKMAGLRCYRAPARRAINSNARKRGFVEEYVITNVPLNLSVGGADSTAQNLLRMS
jgi:DNA adenine methylase